MSDNKIVASKCIICGNKYWSTEGYEAMIRAGLKEDICFACEYEKENKNERPKANS